MKLSLDKIKEITTGAARIFEEDSMTLFRRFTEEQEKLYKESNLYFYSKTFTTAGIKFLFKTDSKKLFLKFRAEYAPTRAYFSVDVFVNGKPIGYIDNFSDIELPQMYVDVDIPLGDFSKEFQLGEGEKTVCVHLPWSANMFFEEISLDDGAFVEGIKPKKKLLAYGDSITHGYDALRPSNRYIARLADMLGAEELNKAIGGEAFFPELAKLKDSFEPDYITVAYGTNDWANVEKELIIENCKGFYENLSVNYPNIKIFAITPIWRKEMYEEKPGGKFEEIEDIIRNCTKELKNVTVVSGFDFVPQDEKYYADLRLHPNDDGFQLYAENLYNKIKDEL